ncbi:hypothetical protein T4A_1273 [Trichinella pseudospiralis]|uniref:Uncharacterized protein n=1 Tax=Trichinella pseudospiralis TaxID=6337 RepID=A0A0V1END0_TRIPS|nr:hypothetical protein T4A_1273 [Trichinella pseudospiralis]KRZ37950.1 hypothetical protein T4C_12849 [Trichinella pseudospiralis]
MVLLKPHRRGIVGLFELHFVCITCCEAVQQVSNLSLCIHSLQANSIQFHQIPTYLFPLSQLFQNLCNGHFWIRKLVMNTNAGHTFKIDAA